MDPHQSADNLNTDDLLITFRETQQMLLRKIYSFKALYLWGSSCTGKTMTITTVLSEKDACFILVNCVELFSQNLIFNHIINDFYTDILAQPPPELSCKIGNNISLFYNLLDKALQTAIEFEPNFKLHIIFKNCERLTKLSSNNDLLSFILLLPEKIVNDKSRISIVLISKQPFDNLANNGELASYRPIEINFPNYKKDEFIELIKDCRVCDSNNNNTNTENQNESEKTLFNDPQSLDFHYNNFCKYVVYGTIVVKTDLREIIQYSKDLWPVYKEICVKYRDEQSRWRHFQRYIEGMFENTKKQGTGNETIQLPYLSKFLLIAAYICSFNPPKTDVRFFCRDSGRLTKKQKTLNKTAVTKLKREESLHLLGPKIFNKERWFNIFEAILPPNTYYRGSLYLEAVVSSLCNMELILAQKNNNIAMAVSDRYIVNVNFEMAEKLANSVNFGNLSEYLWDKQN